MSLREEANNLIDYLLDAIDCHPEHSGSIGVFVNMIRSTWGFIGPFWFPDMFDTIGLRASAGLMAGLVVVVSLVPIGLLQWKGEARRGNSMGRVKSSGA